MLEWWDIGFWVTGLSISDLRIQISDLRAKRMEHRAKREISLKYRII